MKLQKTSKMLKVRDFNDLLSCYLCGGYLINPTAVENCLHTFCRTCIVRHLRSEANCPLCKIAGNFKPIDMGNLRSDDVLRALVFKLVPGLYQKERELAIEYNSQQQINVEEASDEVSRKQETIEEHFFAPNEPISLSLEYHPALLKGCSTSQIPPVRYLQCPACLKIRHLKRFLCSKFDIDPESKRIEVEVIYEDEVLPNDFTLMDVGYCYNWKRHAPMKFTYRILFYGNESQNVSNRKNKCEIEQTPNTRVDAIKSTEFKQNGDLTICADTGNTHLPTTSPILHKALKSKSKSSKSIKITTNKTNKEEVNAPVKMIFARKSNADSGKKPSPKRNNHEDVTYTVTNDFKSLRSNDMRYSDYAVSSTTSNSNSPKSSPKSAQRSGKSTSTASIIVESSPPSAVQSQGASPTTLPKCDIVVSIPQSQMPKSPYSIDDEFENVSLAQLKTASKKSPSTTTTVNVTESAKSGSTRNVPKLKIELNSLKTRLSISKPKSAGVLSGVETSEKRERTKQRKHSLDEVAAPLNDRLDIETYAKNIGLQPIEVLTPPESCEKLKYSPIASPLSSASSTTSSSNNAFPLAIPNELTTTTSFHKKRKKKHSKDSKEPKDSKRRRMHAEISSKPEEESLKMKVKLTAPHNHKSHKSESSGTKKSSEELRKSPPVVRDVKVLTTAMVPDAQITPVNDSILALNKTLGEESRSINHLMMEKERTKEVVKVVKADETLLTLPQTNLLPKPYNNIKDSKLPASPPLPPSLFKTTPLNFNTITVTSTTAGQSKSANNSSKQLDLTKSKQQVPLSTKSTPVPLYNRQSSLNAPKPHPHFIVPSLPRRPSPGTNSYTPSSIASASSKQLGMQLKRSASLDEPYVIGGRAKQVKLDASQRKALYGSYANKPLTPPSTGISISKLADTATNVQSSGGAHNNAVTITARPPGGMTQEQMRWQLPPYTQLHMPFNKPAVEIVRINSNQTAADIHTPALNALKSARMMGPPLSMVKGKKSGGHQLGAMPSSSGVRSPPISLNAAPFGQSRNNPYRLSPPALINLQDRPFTTKKIGTLATDTTYKKAENLCKTNGTTDKQSKQSLVSLRDFRPSSRDHSSIDIIDVMCGGAKDDHNPAADTTVSATAATPSARESLEAALNKIKQNITSTTAQDNAAASAAKQQQLPSPTQMSNEDLQNLHLLSESATTREKIAIRSSQSYEKPKMQPSSMVRQQNASVRNIPNPSALAFRNMSTLPAVSSTLPPVSTVVASQSVTSNSAPSTTSSTVTTSATSQSTQKTLPLVTLPLTSSSASRSPGNAMAVPSTTSISSAVSTTTTITTTRTVKKPTTIDQVAANLNMRASAAAAEAHAAKLNAAEDVAQISSSMGSVVVSQNNVSPLSKATLTTTVASSTTANETSATAAERDKEQTSEATNGADEITKAKVLPKSVADSGVTTAIVTDVASIENTTSNSSSNGNNINNNNNNNNSNSKNNNSNGSSNNDVKYDVTSASVASD